MSRKYRLDVAITERGGAYLVRVAAILGSSFHGAIAQERVCDSQHGAELTRDLLIQQLTAALKVIGAAIDYGVRDAHKLSE